jgi:prepilin peptidase CpaA
MLNTIFLLVFPAAMITAACLDLFTLTIPNRLTIGFAILFLPAAFVAGMPLSDVGMHLAAGAAMLTIAFTFFAFGWIGGGDAKFFAASALWLGWGDILPYVLWFSLLGGALTLAIVSLRKYPLPVMLGTEDWVVRLHDSRSGIPYGIALSTAGLIVYPATIWMKTFTGV